MLSVGAGEAHSLFHALASPAVESVYTGVDGLETLLAPAVASSPALADIITAIGRGSTLALGNNQILASQMNGNGRVRIYTFFRAPKEWAAPD